MMQWNYIATTETQFYYFSGFYGDTGYNYCGSIGVVPGTVVVPDPSVLKSAGRVGSVTGGAGVLPTTPITNNINNNINNINDISNNTTSTVGSGINNTVNNNLTNINIVNNNVTYNDNNANNNIYGDVKVDINAIMTGLGGDMEITDGRGGVKRIAENIGDEYNYQGIISFAICKYRIIFILLLF